MESLPRQIRVTTPLVGVGLDLCDSQRFVGLRQRWGGRVDRVFSQGELAAFPGAGLGLCWAAREAIVKALHARMLGSPLADMVVSEGRRGQLLYRPRERARLQLQAHGVSQIELLSTTIAGVVMIIALAHGVPGAPANPEPGPWRIAWGVLREKHAKDGSARARHAGLLALRQLSRGTATWSGGHGGPPHLGLDLAPGRPTLVSLSHDGGLAGGLVALGPTGPRAAP